MIVWYVKFVDLFNIVNFDKADNIVNLEVYIGSKHLYSTFVVNIGSQHWK